MDRRQLIEHCLSLCGAYEDYPFDTDKTGAEWTVMRHRGNKKSFALIYEREGRLCINLKCDPMEADFLRSSYESVSAGYHMNKVHWNTVVLGGDVGEEELFRQIFSSYELTRPKVKKRV